VLGLVGAGALAGAAGAAVLVSAVFLASAEDIGRQMAAGLGEQIGTSIGDGMVHAMDESLGGVLTDPGTGWSAAVPVEQSPPVAPGELGPDPLMDSYAQDCFAGTLQSCDDLYFQSTPFSEYERYASTCGGRVKPFVVEFCTDLPD
jgi:hypothetical protein